MKFPRPKWYTVDELAKEWEVTSDLIVRYLDGGQLKASARFSNNSGEYWIDILPYGKVSPEDEYSRRLDKNAFKGGYIKLEEVERFENEYEQELPIKKPDYLNPDHPHFSTELSDAVRAWQRTVKQNPDPQKFKAIAKEWLENAEYEGEALKRLATVVNPDKSKKGGAPKKE